MRAAHDITLG